MPIGLNFGGKNQKGKGPTPSAKALIKPFVPFGAHKWPINSWTGKHMPLHKEAAPTAASTTPSTIRLFWHFAAGGDPVEQDVVPANTSGYYWELGTRTDLNNVHSLHMLEVAFPAPTSLSIQFSWDGVVSSCRPATPVGMAWQPVGGTVVGGVITIFCEAECVSTAVTPGRCPANGTFGMQSDPDTPILVTFTNGLCNAPESTVLQMGDGDGNTISVTVGAGGILTGYAGIVAIGDPATGTTAYYRISPSGLLEE